MGADMSEFEMDSSVSQKLEFLHKEESLREIFNRHVNDMINVVMHPKKLAYDVSWTSGDHPSAKEFCATNIDIILDDIVTLRGCQWIKYGSSKRLVVYLHTNARALPDAVEVLPFCNVLGANLLSYDMRGCGKSSGQLFSHSVVDLSLIIEHIVNMEVGMEIILWARGISTYIAIEYASSLTVSANLKYLVLDSPFTTVEEVVIDCASRISLVDIIPSVFIKYALRQVADTAKDSYSFDPYQIQPAKLVKYIHVPCFVLIADDDEYISADMGLRIANSMINSRDVIERIFPGQHFGTRDECLVLTPFERVFRHLSLPADSGDATAIVSVFTKSKTFPDVLLQSEHETNNNNSSANIISNPVLPLLSSTLTASSVSSSVLLWDLTYSATSSSNELLSSSSRGFKGHKKGVPAWVPDNEASSCSNCEREFRTLLRRRHHCRNCGLCVCDDCSQQRVLLIYLETHTPVRVCDRCRALSSTGFGIHK